MRYMKLSEIKIRESFLNSIPKEEKIDECRKYWSENHEQDRYIVVDHSNVLIDGYIQYLVLQENNEDMAEIRVASKKKKQYARKNINKKKCRSNKRTNYRECETTYVFGIHPNSNSTKERVWRIPNSWWSGWADKLNIGDMLLVKTKYGLVPIQVTRIEKMSECPVEFPVKTVIKKLGGFER